MSTCPVPDVAATSNYATPSAAVVAPPTPVDESCNDPGGLTTVGAPGVTSVATQYIPVAGPMGPQGYCGKGFQWINDPWAIDKVYYTWEQGVVCNASTIAHDGSTYVCIQTHIATPENEPGQWLSQDWRAFWHNMADQGAEGPLGIANKFKSMLENAFDFITDIPNWGVGDWIKGLGAAAAVVGAIVVGKKVVDMISDAGETNEEGESADFRYTGTPGLAAAPVYPTLPAVLTRLCLRAGLTADQFDVSKMPTNQYVYGAAITGSASDVLKSLRYVYGFDIVRAVGKLQFVPYDLAPVLYIPMSDMGFESSKSSLSRYSASRVNPTDLPKRVSLTFKNSEMNYHEDQEKAELFSNPKGLDSQVTVPLVLTNEQAKGIAERAMVQAFSQANTITFTLPYKYMDLQPGDNINTEKGLLRVLTIDENPKNVLNITAVSANEVDESLIPSGQPPRIPQASTNKQPVIGFTFGVLLDLPPLNAGDNQPRLYAAVHGYNNKDWPGCNIYETRDGGQTYDVVSSSDRTQSTIGMVEFATAIVPEDKYFVWDNTTQIIVTLKTNQLISAPNDLAVYNGANTCMVGPEMIGFRYAELIGVDAFGNNKYKLTRLLRGLRGTEWAIDEHVDQELFVLIDDALVEIPFPQNEWRRERTYRFVTVGSEPSIVADQTISPNMVNLIPWRVAHPKGGKIASSGDFGFSWVERPSFQNELQNFKQSTKDIDWAGWTVAVLNPADLTQIKRTEHVAAPNFTYTEAMQLEDFGSLQSCVYLKIVTMSRYLGGGYNRTICAS